MTPGELERYLHGHIPLSSAMQVSVEAASAEGVTLGAPLSPNINQAEPHRTLWDTDAVACRLSDTASSCSARCMATCPRCIAPACSSQSHFFRRV